MSFWKMCELTFEEELLKALKKEEQRKQELEKINSLNGVISIQPYINLEYIQKLKESKWKQLLESLAITIKQYQSKIYQHWKDQK